ncbi:MAG: Sulfurtransferase [uncultured Sulfurovum sp.]|uniref:Sulfurtransferase n=1 Tax=uncultured Sulfurovum sp. TaxID=269237 RepID=A0A6S6TL29_9BACT|nr:MAG: Sulfurtransferase [uncultured Sulfurovum sp.]
MRLLRFYLLSICCTGLYANNVEISEGVPYVEFTHNEKTYKIERNQNRNARLTNTFALTSRPSPPFFVEPFSVASGIETYGELEVLNFIEKKKGLFIDARLSNWYERSTIPSSVNIPFKKFLSETPERKEILKRLGVLSVKKGVWDFSEAKTLLLYCNGAWCGQSPTAIEALIEIGYPKHKMKYYRGGMQAWQLLGLSTVVPSKERK